MKLLILLKVVFSNWVKPDGGVHQAEGGAGQEEVLNQTRQQVSPQRREELVILG